MKSRFTDLLKDKATNELLTFLRKWGSEPDETDSDYLSLLISEIQTRDLTIEQQAELNKLISELSRTGMTESKSANRDVVKDKELDNIQRKGDDSVRLLRNQINVVGFLFMIAGLIIFIDNANSERRFDGIYVLLISIGFSVILFALSVILRVLHNKNENTRSKETHGS